MLFIVIHQVYELWFKQVLHELDHLQRALDDGRPARGAAHPQAHPDHPQDPGGPDGHPGDDDAASPSSRSATGSTRRAASSRAQFRELEVAAGLTRPARCIASPEGTPSAPAARAARRASRASGTRSCASSRARATRSRRRCWSGTSTRRARADRERAGDPDRRLPPRSRCRRRVRAARRPRRGAAGVALPPRQDGRAHHRHQAAAPAARPAPSTCAPRSSRRSSPTCGPFAPALSGRRSRADLASLAATPNALAPHYARFRVAERLLLTGHSHQAWPDVALRGTAARPSRTPPRCVDEKWERAFARADRVRAGLPAPARR